MEPGKKIFISCREATSLDEMRREGKITKTGSFALWFHLLYCKFCRLFIKQSVMLQKFAADLAGNDKAFAISADRKERMKKALEQK